MESLPEGLRDGPLPLVIDLDGALLPAGLEQIVLQHLDHGVARFMRRMRRTSERADLRAVRLASERAGDDITLLFNRDMLALAATQHRLGGKVILMGQAQMGMIAALSDALNMQAEIFGADPDDAFGPDRQERVLTALFGPRGFTYVGGARAPEPICAAARQALLVDGPAGLKARLRIFGGQVTLLPLPVWGRVDLRLADLAMATDPGVAERLNRRVSRHLWAAQEVETQTRAASDAREVEPGRRRA